MTTARQCPLDVACVIPSLRTGGSERVLSSLASDLSGDGHRVAIITLMPAGEAPYYPLAPRVDVAGTGDLGAATSLGRPTDILRASWRVRRCLQARAPGLVLGFTTLGSMLAVLASRGLGLPVIAAERVDPQGHGRHIGRLRASVRDALFARADHVVVQTRRARSALSWLADNRVSCIANPVYPAARRANPDRAGPDGRFLLLGVGRLDPQKGFDLLVSAFTRLAERFPDWDLVIHGDGPERSSLEALARHAPAGRIRLPGVTADIEGALTGAHAFAFPSRYEGFPNALAEAMAASLPTIGYLGVSGVEDLIVPAPREAATGLLADLTAPIDSLADGLALLMADGGLRCRLGDRARQHVAAFTPQLHYEQWQRLLTRVAQSHSGH